VSKVALFTGAGRGIGLELCRALLHDGYRVLACPRRPGSAELAGLVSQSSGQASEIALDVSDDTSIASAVRTVEQEVEHIDLLFNNGGVYPKDRGGIETIELSDLSLAFDVNAIGPLRVVRAFLPLLRKGSGKRLIQLTSLMGSVGDNTSGGSYAYRMSKIALNMAVRNLAHELGREGFIALAIHPGWVKTRMGGQVAPLELEPAVRDILRTSLETTMADNGSFRGPGGRVEPY
jgi:NAD(P)-dependent dehydrogenase (short-subunit alcohol dehydrogenase family)